MGTVLTVLRRGEAFAILPPDLWILSWQMLRPYRLGTDYTVTDGVVEGRPRRAVSTWRRDFQPRAATHARRSSRSVLASRKSTVSKPSVNQL